MHHWFRLCALVVLLVVSLPLPGATIILVRHAEKAPGTGDVPLSALGQQRARTLEAMLADAGVRAIFTTQWTRTRQTAAPLAAKLNLTPVAVPAKEMDALLKHLNALGDNDTVLVVGHSDTLPAIAAALGTPPVGAIAETEFDRMLIVRTGAGQKPSLLTLRYGTSQ